jgi:hypothetical protein
MAAGLAIIIKSVHAVGQQEASACGWGRRALDANMSECDDKAEKCLHINVQFIVFALTPSLGGYKLHPRNFRPSAHFSALMNHLFL